MLVRKDNTECDTVYRIVISEAIAVVEIKPKLISD